jgi:putative transposase
MANQAAYSVRMMCRLLGVSTSGFYVWEDRPPSPRSRYVLYLTSKIYAIHRRSNGAYGSPMIHAKLSDDHGIHVGCKRVARLMRAAHLQGVWPHRFVITTVREEGAKQPIDLVD